MRRTFLFIALLILSSLRGQYRIDDGSELLTLQKVPMEKMYVHLSSALLFSGEYLYYKVYSLNAATGKQSTISELAYISLVNSGGMVQFEHKIALNAGQGQGDYFVNTDLPSGTYKLLGYTNWMKNGGLGQLFQQDVLIINPYRTDQSGILSDAAGESATKVGNPAYPESNTTRGGLLELQLDTTAFQTRERVSLTLRNYKGSLAFGNYSLVVRKVSDLSNPGAVSAEQFSQVYAAASRQLPQSVGDSVYLPEQRGELVFGRVVRAGDDAPATGVEVIISIPGKGYILKSATTDQDGFFYSYLRRPYAQSDIFYQAIGGGDYKILPGQFRDLDLSSLDTGHYPIKPEARELIVSRSIHNQLENAYFQIKPDSVITEDAVDPFDGGIPEVFNLDDYTRFPTFQETLVEILNFVGYRNNPDGPDYIRVGQDFDTYYEEYNSDPAIVLIDGVFIQDHNAIKSFNARRIKTISVLRDPLTMGPNRYQGIVYIETFDGNYWETHSAPNLLAGELDFPRPEKRYFRQKYAPQVATAYDRAPDYRYILLWEPKLEVDGTALPLEFYTSDVAGTYEIALEGFTSYGKPITLRKRFVVQGTEVSADN